MINSLIFIMEMLTRNIIMISIWKELMVIFCRVAFQECRFY